MGCGCQKTFNDYIIGSPDEVTIHALLAADTSYVWEVVDGFGNIYQQDFTTDSDGIGILNMADLPAGFANPSQAGAFIRVKNSSDDCTYVPLVIVQRFAQIQMNFRAGTATKNWLACPLVAPEPGEVIELTTEDGETLLTESGENIII